MDSKKMIEECRTKGLLCFDEPKKVEGLLTKINKALANYQVGIKPNENKDKRSGEEIEITITDNKGKLLKTELYTDRIHIQGDLRRIRRCLRIFSYYHLLTER